MIEAKKMIKSGQEQAVASWINYLNQVRLDRLMEALQKEELCLPLVKHLKLLAEIS